MQGVRYRFGAICCLLLLPLFWERSFGRDCFCDCDACTANVPQGVKVSLLYQIAERSACPLPLSLSLPLLPSGDVYFLSFDSILIPDEFIALRVSV